MTHASRRARQPPGDDQHPGPSGTGYGDSPRHSRGMYLRVYMYLCIHGVVVFVADYAALCATIGTTFCASS